MLESQGRIPAAFPVFSRRTALTLGLAAGTGATLGRPTSAANAAVMAESLETTHGPEIPLTIIGNEPSIVLRRYRNVFSSVPDAAATFFRTDGGVLKIAGGCTGLADQLQILDAATGKREKSLFPSLAKEAASGTQHTKQPPARCWLTERKTPSSGLAFPAPFPMRIPLPRSRQMHRLPSPPIPRGESGTVIPQRGTPHDSTPPRRRQSTRHGSGDPPRNTFAPWPSTAKRRRFCGYRGAKPGYLHLADGQSGQIREIRIPDAAA